MVPMSTTILLDVALLQMCNDPYGDLHYRSDHPRGHVLPYCFAGSLIRKYETNSPFCEHLVVVVLMTGTTHE
jgi:hypothetical protein